jgi:hypothetical protein
MLKCHDTRPDEQPNVRTSDGDGHCGILYSERTYKLLYSYKSAGTRGRRTRPLDGCRNLMQSSMHIRPAHPPTRPSIQLHRSTRPSILDCRPQSTCTNFEPQPRACSANDTSCRRSLSRLERTALLEHELNFAHLLFLCPVHRRLATLVLGVHVELLALGLARPHLDVVI